MMKNIIGFLTIFISTTCNAILIDQGNTTLDTDTGYVWLDVSLTTNCDYSVIFSGGSCNGLDLSDWTLATTAEVYELWGNAGITPENSLTYTTANTTEIANVIALVGITAPTSDTWYGVNGFLADDTNLTAQLFVNDETSRDYIFYAFTDPVIGGWLYMSQDNHSVPAPASIALFGLGLVGIGFSRRKKV